MNIYPCIGGCERFTNFEPCEVCGNATCQDCGPCMPRETEEHGYGCIHPGNGFRRINDTKVKSH